MKQDKLTDEQLKNWRRTLAMTIGPYALIMPAEEVQRIRDKMQNDLNKEANK